MIWLVIGVVVVLLGGVIVLGFALCGAAAAEYTGPPADAVETDETQHWNAS